MIAAAHDPGCWLDGELPDNASLGSNTIVRGDLAFKRFHSKKKPALIVGDHCTFDGVHFALGENAVVRMGNYCCFSPAVLLCELELHIGNYVVIGWNATIADTDFHPISPAQRIADAVACSPLGTCHPRPPIAAKPVFIEDDVWIGPSATILKGVRIGTPLTSRRILKRAIPTGKGLFAFQTMDNILAAVDEIESDYAGNCRAAREIAREYFAAEKVLASLMKRAGL